MLQFIVFQYIFVTLLSFSNAWYDEDEAAKGIVMRLHNPPPPVYLSNKKAKKQFFHQRLDHFNAQNSKHWSQKFFEK